VVVLAGQTSANFTMATSQVLQNVRATVTASTRGITKTAFVDIQAPVPVLHSFTVDPVEIMGGLAVAGTVNLVNPAPAGGVRVLLRSSIPQATVPQFVTVNSGHRTARFTIRTGAVTNPLNATLTATYGNLSKVAILKLSPLTVLSIAASTSSIRGGSSFRVTVRSTGPATATGMRITLISSNPQVVVVPSVVTIRPGTNNVSAGVGTRRVTARHSVTIYARYGNVTKSTQISVVP
jgi:hypothetical protein